MNAVGSRRIYKTAVLNGGANVQCASVNKSSLQSFATGHEDGAINIWKIGDAQALASFDSNLSITCLDFNHADGSNQKQLVSGNIGGGIKLYDTHKANLLRNYAGHRCEITDIKFFDFNGSTLILSSSSDRNVKIWDIRSKSTVVCLKGHSATVNCVDFSPDGNWIVSGDDIGHSKLWSLSTSKCIHEFHDKQPIHDVAFHPEELVLATAAGKVVRFWDLETMKHISRTSKVTTPVQRILFPQQSDSNTDVDASSTALIAGSSQSLRVWRWDPLPVFCMNNIAVHWHNKLGDIAQMKGFNDLICLELDKKACVAWLSDLGEVFGAKERAKKETAAQKARSVEEVRVGVTVGVDSDQETQGADAAESEEEVYDDEFEEIDEEDIPFEKPTLGGDDEFEITADKATIDANQNQRKSDELDEKSETAIVTPTPGDDGSDDTVRVPGALQNMPREMWTQSFFDAAEIVRKQRSEATPKEPKRRKVLKPLIPRKTSPAFSTQKQLKRSPSAKDEGDGARTAFLASPFDGIDAEKENERKGHNSLKLAQFIPRHLADYDDRELIKMKRTMMGAHIPTMKMLSTRLRYLRQLRSLWKKKRLSEFVEIAKQIQSDDANRSLFASFIHSVLRDIETKEFSFRFCSFLLRAIDLRAHMLDVGDEKTVVIVLRYIHFVLDTFSSLITQTLSSGVLNEKDLNQIDRHENCEGSHEWLSNNAKTFILRIQNNAEPPCIKIAELCANNLSLIELL